jgi:hypothetical protein
MVKNTLAVFGFLAVLLFSLATANASEISFSPTSLSATGGNGTTADMTLTMTNSYVTDLTVMSMAFSNLVSGSNTLNSGNLSIPQVNSTSTIQGSNGTLSATLSVQIPSGQVAGTYTGEMNLTGTISTASLRGTVNITLTVTNPTSTTPVTNTSTYNFCSNGEQGDLEISDLEFTNLGEGEDDDWFLLDEIEIEIEIENTHSIDNVKDVLVEIMIRDDDNNDVTSEFEFSDEEIDLNTIKDDDSKIATFTIDEIPADLDSGNYKVYIKAYSEDDEDTQCIAEASTKYLDQETYQSIEVTREDDPAVVIKDEDLTKVYASCGDTNVELPLDIYNLGSDKEEKVLVTLTSTILGVNERVVIDNLKSGKRKEIIFYFDVPAQLSKESYNLDITTYYDYDDDEDELEELSYSENSEDDLDKDFSARLELLSCAGAAPRVDASLDSIAEVGTELVIKTMITNNGADNEFVISASGFESWAELVSVTPVTASIKEGEFQEVIVVLMPTDEGSHSFNIETIADGETNSQSVSVNITGEPGFFKGISNNMLFIAAGSVLFVLMIVIVIVALSRISSRRV